jgi:FkbM family methyltransferase
MRTLNDVYMIQVERYQTSFGNICCLPNDFEFIKALSLGKMYEEDLVLSTIIPLFNKPHKYVILDVGAHIGSHSVIYSKSIPNCEILSFEPQSVLHKILTKNICDNDIRNCTIYNNAVGHKLMQTNMIKSFHQDGQEILIEYRNASCGFNYGAIGLGEGGENVNMITIDSLDLKQCDYIKIDVEGAEILVLMGALNTINKFHPAIFFEENGLSVTDAMVKSMNIDFEYDTPRNCLTQLGYTVTKVNHFNSLATYSAN